MNNPKHLSILLMALMAFIILAGHIGNYHDIGGVRWFVGLLAGVCFSLLHYKANSALLWLVTTGTALVLLATAITGTLSDPRNKIALSSFGLGVLVVMILRAPWGTSGKDNDTSKGESRC